MIAGTGPAGMSRRQTALGVGLACAVVVAWASLHLYGVLLHRWTPAGIALAPLLVALQCWLNVGLFIVAHDCMHGSLAPFRPRVNLWIGRLCLTLYAGFSYDNLIRKHFDHHRYPGTARDPDFNDEDPEHFWRWYMAFLRRYFGVRSALSVAGVAVFYTAVLGAGLANVLLLWALPAILSSLQLFYFGTYLPHRHEEGRFADQHNSRSNDLNWLSSLLTCFHFGYHHEHHLAPQVPWWDLPRARALRRA
jgi:beta-carotene ketolase (CrtW type)